MDFAKSYRKYRTLNNRISYHTGGVSYTPPQLGRIYGFPPGLDGSGQTIALIELGGGFKQSDYDSYMSSLGLPSSQIGFVSVDGGTNAPTTPDSADGEVMLDICVAGALAPGAKVVVYMAPNTDKGFVNAVLQAVADRVAAISISWGSPEDNWQTPAMNDMTNAFKKAQAAGITVTAASGDNGSSDGLPGKHVDFPASDPYALGCGGTSMPMADSAGRTETVWNNGMNGGATGGGVSTKFKLPSYQHSANVPGSTFRGVPDVAGLADPETGIKVIVDGQIMVIGGTSAVAPFWAAVVAVLNQGLGRRVGLLNPSLYALSAPLLATSFKDILQGNNGTYMARPGYDCCTGTGTPNVAALMAALGGAIPTTTTAQPTTTQPPVGTTPQPPVTTQPPLDFFTLSQPIIIPAGSYRKAP